jgi:hypothetical protein
VFLHFSRPEVGNLLARRLGLALGRDLHVAAGLPPPGAPNTIVVADSRAVSTEQCDRLARAGHPVVVIAAIPRDDDRTGYLRAGARAYLPMALDVLPLIGVLLDLS